MPDKPIVDNAAPAPKKPPSRTSLIKIEFPKELTPFVLLGCGIGVILCAAAFVSAGVNDKWTAPSSVLLGAGIGIILSAFGGQATVRGKGFVLAGVAAISVALIWGVEHFEERRLERENALFETQSKNYARGEITNLLSGYDYSMKFADEVLGKFDARARQFDFIVFRPELSQARIATLRLQPADDPDGLDIRMEVSRDCIRNAIGQEDRLHWELRRIDQTLELRDLGRSGAVIARTAPDQIGLAITDACPAGPVEASAGATGGWLASVLSAIVPSALAQEILAPEPYTPEQLAGLFADLTSDDAGIRRGARDTLAAAAVTNVPDLMSALTANIDDYRIKLGISVALAEMLRQDIGRKDDLSNVLTYQDIGTLLDLAGDPDRTVRIYATEFLFDLQNPTVAQMAIERAAETDDVAARYQWLFAAQGGWPYLTEDDKALLESSLDAVATAAREASSNRTLELIEGFE